MSGSRDDEAAEFVDERNASTSKTAEAKDSPNYMADADRLLAFLVIASVADSGLSVSDAGIRLSEEYQASGKTKEARALKRFFTVVADAAAGKEGIDIAAACRESFGKTFVSAEEALILSRIGASPFPAATLRDAMAVISHKMAAAARASRFVG
jgi:hypothetical protein